MRANARGLVLGWSDFIEKSYDAFGNVVSASGVWKSQFGYAGKFGYQSDPDTGLKLLGHRHYDSDTGRFLTRDPIKDGRNWYSYCDNNPVSFFDANGLAKIVIVVGDGNFDEDVFPQRFLDLMNIIKEYLESQGHEVIVLLAPSPENLAKALHDADGLVFIGHGIAEGMNSRHDGERMARNGKTFTITPEWIAGVLKGRKLKWIVSYSCNLFANSIIAQNWAALADYVYGFDNVDSHVHDMIKNWKNWAKGKYIPKGELPRRWHPKSNNGKGGLGTPLVPNLFANP